MNRTLQPKVLWIFGVLIACFSTQLMAQEVPSTTFPSGLRQDGKTPYVGFGVTVPLSKLLHSRPVKQLPQAMSQGVTTGPIGMTGSTTNDNVNPNCMRWYSDCGCYASCFVGGGSAPKIPPPYPGQPSPPGPPTSYEDPSSGGGGGGGSSSPGIDADPNAVLDAPYDSNFAPNNRGIKCTSFVFTKTSSNWQEAGVKGFHITTVWVEGPMGNERQNCDISGQIVIGLPIEYRNGTKVSPGQAAEMAANLVDAAARLTFGSFKYEPVPHDCNEVERVFRRYLSLQAPRLGGVASYNGSGNPNILVKQSEFALIGTGNCDN